MSLQKELGLLILTKTKNKKTNQTTTTKKPVNFYFLTDVEIQLAP